MSRPTTVDAYLAGFEEPRRARLGELRALARAAVPDATEAIKWGAPAWVHPDGTILFVLAGYARQANVTFTPSTREAFADDLTGHDTGKGSIKLPYTAPVPAALLRRMIAYRVREHEEDGVGWM